MVLSSEIADEDEFSEDLVVFRTEAQTGQTVTSTLALQPGTYQVVCAIAGHFSAGMEGVLTVVDN